MAKTKEEKRKAWREYAAKNRLKYRCWALGWKSGSGVTPEEFFKQHKAKREAERKARAAKKAKS
jgi:hypothetical protein